MANTLSGVHTAGMSAIPVSTMTADGPEWFTRLHDREPGFVKVVLEP